MELMLWIFNFSEHACVIKSRQYSRRSAPDLHSASAYEKDEYNSFKQRFCTRSTCLIVCHFCAVHECDKWT